MQIKNLKNGPFLQLKWFRRQKITAKPHNVQLNFVSLHSGGFLSTGLGKSRIRSPTCNVSQIQAELKWHGPGSRRCSFCSGFFFSRRTCPCKMNVAVKYCYTCNNYCFIKYIKRCNGAWYRRTFICLIHFWSDGTTKNWTGSSISKENKGTGSVATS